MSNTLTFVDLDETLFYTFAKIRVMKNGECIKSLTNSQYNTYELQTGEWFDYSEFKSVSIFKESVPMISNIQQILDTENECIILTARADMDDKDEFLKFLQSHGIDVGHYTNKKIHIVRCGELGLVPANAKVEMINRILDKRPEIGVIELYDDSLANLNAVDEQITRVHTTLYQVYHDTIYKLEKI